MVTEQSIENGNSNVQVAGDVNILQIKKDLAPASSPIRTSTSSPFTLGTDEDKKSTVLIKKLKNGGFNCVFIQAAIRKKLDALSIIIDYSRTESGKCILKDIYENLLTIINNKYVSQLNEGESLKTSVTSFINDFSDLSRKYVDQLTIDEAFLDGLLYLATSKCALKWKVDGDADNADDNQSN